MSRYQQDTWARVDCIQAIWVKINSEGLLMQEQKPPSCLVKQYGYTGHDWNVPYGVGKKD